MESLITSKGVFSHLGVIWREVMNQEGGGQYMFIAIS